jgi:hypothetical protein
MNSKNIYLLVSLMIPCNERLSKVIFNRVFIMSADITIMIKATERYQAGHTSTSKSHSNSCSGHFEKKRIQPNQNLIDPISMAGLTFPVAGF